MIFIKTLFVKLGPRSMKRRSGFQSMKLRTLPDVFQQNVVIGILEVDRENAIFLKN